VFGRNQERRNPHALKIPFKFLYSGEFTNFGFNQLRGLSVFASAKPRGLLCRAVLERRQIDLVLLLDCSIAVTVFLEMKPQSTGRKLETNSEVFSQNDSSESRAPDSALGYIATTSLFWVRRASLQPRKTRIRSSQQQTKDHFACEIHSDSPPRTL
jgi:hypothetical protein